jgi:hydrogenase maturation protein HypF
MLPYTPLHHLLMSELGFPVVATSGNLSGEPIATDNRTALAKLGNIADLFLLHNRPIARHVDDSVVFALEEDIVTLRRARGYAPTPVPLGSAADGIIAAGAQQKNTIAVAHHGSAILSQYLGDMDNAAVFDAFTQALADLQRLHEMQPTTVACDLHPDYTATRHAEQMGLPVVHVQHHYAHVLSCLAEHQLDAPALGVAWDGTGYGTDGTIWGGEFLRVDDTGFSRAAYLRPFPLPGGDLAAREPRRSALGILYGMYGKDLPRERLAFSAKEIDLLIAAIERGVNAPLTSSMGRLFDAVASLAGLRQQCSFEGQAAMALEYAQAGANTDECYPIEITPVTGESDPKQRIIEWKPMIAAILDESDVPLIATKFHNTLAALIVSIAQQVGEPNVVLTGGCFQNRSLLEQTIRKLREAGFKPYWHRRVPANDGGIALGQISAALRESSHVSGSSGQTH